LDIAVFSFINHLPHPFWADKGVLFLEYLGEARTLLILAFLPFISGILLKKKEWWQRASVFACAVFLTELTVILLKHGIHRARPYAVLSGVYWIGHAAGSSFPSSHAALFAVLAVWMMLFLKKAHLFWLGLMGLGGLARVYQGAHYPTDVLGGWFVGALTAWGICNLFNFILKSVEL